MGEEKNNTPERNQYRSSFAATVLFSGVQIYQILIRIIKSKFVAILIGPLGMGIQSLLHSTTETIYAATSFGLRTSSVKTIAAANREGDKNTIAKSIAVLRRLIWITGMLGLLVCALFSPIWSNASFGNNAYIWSFVGVSLVILFDQLNGGELALLQGMQQKKKLARANVIGQTINALITIPLYYFWGVKAIVAALVLGSFISYIISYVYARRLEVHKVQLSWRETFSIGREMMKLGFFLSLQSLMANMVVLIIRNYVSSTGGVEEVGLYSAGTTIITTYIGLVFTAIATDYYPRLAATRDNSELSDAVHTQAELTILLLAPIAISFIVFCQPAILLLYSEEFLPVVNMMYWAIAAVLFQAAAWAVSYTLLAKAKPTVFFINELISTAWGLPLKLLCYKYWGLTGFGMATMITYCLYLIQVLLISKKLFSFTYKSSIWKLLFSLYVPVGLTVVLKLMVSDLWGYIFGTTILILSAGVVFYKLNKLMDLRSYLMKFKKGNNAR